MAKTLITGKAQTVTMQDFNARVERVLVGKVYPLKGRTYQKTFKTGLSGAIVK